MSSLGLTPSEDGSRWLRPGEREPARHRRFDGIDDEEAGDLGWIEGDVAPPLEQLVAEEDLDRRRRSAAAELVRPAPATRRTTLAEFAARIQTGDFPHLDREEVERRARADPTMMHFEGTGPTWPINPTPAGECGACQGQPLEFRTYCLVCDRSGADHIIRPVPRLDPPRDARAGKTARVARTVAARAVAGLKGGIG